MDLYTILMDFRGGTYISQVQAPNNKKAVEIWAKSLKAEDIQYFSDKSKNQLIEAIPELTEDIAELTGLNNVWCFSFQFKTGFAIMNMVKTVY